MKAKKNRREPLLNQGPRRRTDSGGRIFWCVSNTTSRETPCTVQPLRHRGLRRPCALGRFMALCEHHLICKAQITIKRQLGTTRCRSIKTGGRSPLPGARSPLGRTVPPLPESPTWPPLDRPPAHLPVRVGFQDGLDGPGGVGQAGEKLSLQVGHAREKLSLSGGSNS